MPYLNPMTYREFKALLADSNKLKHYVSTDPILKKPAALQDCLMDLLQNYDHPKQVLTPTTYLEIADTPVPDSYLYVQLFACHPDFYETMDFPKVPHWTIPRSFIQNMRNHSYIAKADLAKYQRSRRFYTKVYDKDDKDVTTTSLEDFRFYYNNYMFWKHRVVSTHYVSYEYSYMGEFPNETLHGHLIVSQGYYYDVTEPQIMVPFNDERLQQEVCLALPFPRIGRYNMPVRVLPPSADEHRAVI